MLLDLSSGARCPLSSPCYSPSALFCHDKRPQAFCVFPAPAWESAKFPRSPSVFVLVLWVLTAIGVSFQCPPLL